MNITASCVGCDPAAENPIASIINQKKNATVFAFTVFRVNIMHTNQNTYLTTAVCRAWAAPGRAPAGVHSHVLLHWRCLPTFRLSRDLVSEDNAFTFIHLLTGRLKTPSEAGQRSRCND
jgi:hypothetical protein